MTVSPAQNVVCMRPIEHKTSSGIIISEEDAKRKSESAEVVAFGGGGKPIEFKEGDILIYQTFAEHRIGVGGQDYIFVEFRHILGKVESK